MHACTVIEPDTRGKHNLSALIHHGFANVADYLVNNHPCILRVVDCEEGRDSIVAFLATVVPLLFVQLTQETDVVDAKAVMFGGVCWLLPGFMITSAIMDFTTGNNIPVAHKAIRVLIVFLQLCTGFWFALSIFGISDVGTYRKPNSTPCGEDPFFDGITAICVLISGFALIVLMDCNRKHWKFLLFCLNAGFWSSQAVAQVPILKHCKLSENDPSGDGNVWIRTTLSALVGSFVVGVLSNWWERRTGNINLEAQTLALFMLAPGSWPLRGLLDDASEIVSFLQLMLLIALALVTGLWIARLIAPPSIAKVNVASIRQNAGETLSQLQLLQKLDGQPLFYTPPNSIGRSDYFNFYHATSDETPLAVLSTSKFWISASKVVPASGSTISLSEF